MSTIERLERAEARIEELEERIRELDAAALLTHTTLESLPRYLGLRAYGVDDAKAALAKALRLPEE